MPDKRYGILQNTGNLEVTVYDGLIYRHMLTENLERDESWVGNCSEELLDEPVVMHKLASAQLNSVSEATFLRLSDYPFS